MFSWYDLQPYEILDGQATIPAIQASVIMSDLLRPHGVWYKYEVCPNIVRNMKAYLTEHKNIVSSKRKKPTSAPTTPRSTGFSEQPIRWVNISLTDDDAAFLADLEVTLDVLASQFVALAPAGWDISLKRKGNSDECMASAICDDPHVEGGRVGISAWSDNFPDALAALLYKLSDKLGDGIPAPNQHVTRRFR